VAYQHQPSARDAGLAKVAALTVALSVAGVAGTAGIGMAIANAAPAPKKAGPDYTKGKPNGSTNQAGGKNKGGGTTKPQPQPTGGGTVAPPDDRPESSSGDEQTSSGGS
jgi:hypothetical protein